jgi:hypothetical protein
MSTPTAAQVDALRLAWLDAYYAASQANQALHEPASASGLLPPDVCFYCGSYPKRHIMHFEDGQSWLQCSNASCDCEWTPDVLPTHRSSHD